METLTERTDLELVAMHRAGDPRAFEELHKRYIGPIYRLVRRKLGDGLLAEDIAQETFLKALKTIHRMDETFNVGGWLHTVARNLCYDELRRRQRDPRVDEPDDGDLMMALPAPSGALDPVRAQESAELRRQIYAVSQRLPEKYRLVLTLRELQGMSYRQIARVMKLSESAVETLVYRARLRFKEEFLASQDTGPLECAEVEPLLAPYLAGKLRRSQDEMVRQHVASCIKCTRRIGGARVPARSPGLEVMERDP